MYCDDTLLGDDRYDVQGKYILVYAEDLHCGFANAVLHLMEQIRKRIDESICDLEAVSKDLNTLSDLYWRSNTVTGVEEGLIDEIV